MTSADRKIYETPDFVLTEFEIDDIISISVTNKNPRDGEITAWY